VSSAANNLHKRMFAPCRRLETTMSTPANYDSLNRYTMRFTKLQVDEAVLIFTFTGGMGDP
jgi:hypothetical protein